MSRNLILISLFLMISNCVTSGTALLGPSVTVARTGNIYQAGLSYGSGQIINKTKQILEKNKKTETFVYKRVDQLHKKMTKNNGDKITLKNQADLFFKTVKNSLNKYN